jgi:hypothetical protein
MLSHWSRLIDLPLAILISGFSLVMPERSAEWLTHIVWPVSLLAALLWVVYRTTAKVAGEIAGGIALVMVVFCPLAIYQFAVGRIDHHNAMIAAIISAVLLIWSNPTKVTVWRTAGVLVGLSVAIGYEALAPAVAIGTFLTIWGMLDHRAAKPLSAFAVALALTFAAAFVVTTAPSRWLDIHCDAISLNMVALIVFGTSGVAIASGPGRDWPLMRRLATIAAASGIGLAIFAVLEPKCLAGPEGQLPALLSKVWMDKVAEAQSIPVEIWKGDLSWLGALAFLVIALAALARQTWENRTPANIFLLAMAVTLFGLACWQNKFTPYASYISIVALAVAVSRLGCTKSISAGTVRAVMIILTSQAFLFMAADALDSVAGQEKPLTDAMRAKAAECSKAAAIDDLESLPPGLIAAFIDTGAYIAGLTHHRVLAAPYHRIANAIIANHQIFDARDPVEAGAILKREHVDYVALCDGIDGPYASDEKSKGTLRARLLEGRAPKFLVPVPLPNPHSIYHVWKVDRAALNPLPSTAAASTP